MARTNIKINDAVWRKLEMRVANLCDSSHAKVGVLASTGGDADAEGASGITVAELARIHEFGDGKLPERSFIRATMAAKETELGVMAAKATGAVIEGHLSPARALDIIGAFAAGEVKRFIATDQVRPEITQASKEAKNIRRGQAPGAKTVTLVDTGQLLNSIGHEVIS